MTAPAASTPGECASASVWYFMQDVLASRGAQSVNPHCQGCRHSALVHREAATTNVTNPWRMIWAAHAWDKAVRNAELQQFISRITLPLHAASAAAVAPPCCSGHGFCLCGHLVVCACRWPSNRLLAPLTSLSRKRYTYAASPFRVALRSRAPVMYTGRFCIYSYRTSPTARRPVCQWKRCQSAVETQFVAHSAERPCRRHRHRHPLRRHRRCRSPTPP